MTNHPAPDEIWLDSRVAKQCPQEPDENAAASGATLVRYYSHYRVRELLSMKNPEEFFVQFAEVGGAIHALTNFGKLYRMHYSDVPGIPQKVVKWTAIETPFEGGPDHA